MSLLLKAASIKVTLSNTSRRFWWEAPRAGCGNYLEEFMITACSTSIGLVLGLLGFRDACWLHYLAKLLGKLKRRRSNRFTRYFPIKLGTRINHLKTRAVLDWSACKEQTNMEHTPHDLNARILTHCNTAYWFIGLVVYRSIDSSSFFFLFFLALLCLPSKPYLPPPAPNTMPWWIINLTSHLFQVLKGKTLIS